MRINEAIMPLYQNITVNIILYLHVLLSFDIFCMERDNQTVSIK